MVPNFWEKEPWNKIRLNSLETFCVLDKLLTVSGLAYILITADSPDAAAVSFSMKYASWDVQQHFLWQNLLLINLSTY